MIEIGRPLVIAFGGRLAVTATMNDRPRERETLNVMNLVKRYFKGDDLNSVLPKDKLLASIFYSLAYGGVQLIYIGEKVVPISRYLPEIRIDIAPCTASKHFLIKDDEILDLWALLVSGEEEKFLDIVSNACLIYPEGYKVIEGDKDIVPVGLIDVEEAEG